IGNRKNRVVARWHVFSSDLQVRGCYKGRGFVGPSAPDFAVGLKFPEDFPAFYARARVVHRDRFTICQRTGRRRRRTWALALVRLTGGLRRQKTQAETKPTNHR